MGEQDHQPLTAAVFHILLALSDGAMHGYAVMRRVSEDSGVEMGPGTVYGSLQRLASAGWVEEVPRSDASGDTRRGRAFSLTADGEAALRAEASRIRRLAGMVDARPILADGEA